MLARSAAGARPPLVTDQVRKARLRGFSLFVAAITLVISWMLITNSCGDYMSARELAVQQDVRMINTAQATYRSRFGGVR